MISYKDKNFKEKIQDFIYPNEQILYKMICPKCNCQGQFYRHGFYVRFLFVLCVIANLFKSEKIKISVLRVKCKNCGKTHAILDCEVIPYCRYSISFIMEVLATHFISQVSIEDICIEFEISERTFALFLDYYNLEFIDLKSYNQNGYLSREDLFEEVLNEDIIDFLNKFFIHTKRHFLHKLSSGYISKFKNRSFHITFFIIGSPSDKMAMYK
jgi:hypothetical protein